MPDGGSFDYTKFLEVARTLHGLKTEAGYRSAISRAYYAAFWGARRQAQSKGYQPSESGDAHKSIWDLFSRRRECREIWVIGDRLFNLRKKADYDDPVAGLDKNSESALEDAKDLLALLSTHKNTCPF